MERNLANHLEDPEPWDKLPINIINLLAGFDQNHEQ